MKIITAALKAHLAGVVTTMAQCWLIERLDGQQFAFTSLDADLVINGVTFQSTLGFSRTAITTGSTGQVDNLEVLGFFSDNGITEQDLNNGLFNYATIYLFAVNWADLSMGICKLRRGWLGECIRSPTGTFHAELRGLIQALTQEFGNIYSPICRADLGDPQCKVPILPPAWQPNTAYAAGAYIAPLTKSTDALKTAIFQVTTAGISGATEPAWDTSSVTPFAPPPPPPPPPPVSPPTMTITPSVPTGVIVATAFTFSGKLTGYTAAPSLTYAIDGGTAHALTGVTISGWSIALTIATTGSHTIVVSDGTLSATVTFAVTASGVVRVPAPLTGTVTPGTWVQNQRLSVPAMPNGFIAYDYLLPANYNAAYVYPILIYGHENSEGMNGGSYPGSSLSTATDTIGAGISIDSTFNSVAFRTAFPCIVIVPYCDQTLDTSGANPNANFGGYADTPNSGGNERGINALVYNFIANFSVDLTRIYATGDSLGAIGTLAWLVDNNAYNGLNRLFAAGMGFSDQLFRPNVNGGSNAAAFTSMREVPYLAISTPNDNNQQIYDQAGWTFYTGNANYPTPTSYASGGVAALQAAGSAFYYMNTTVDVPWNTYRQLNADGGQGTALYAWLFEQVSGGLIPTITITGVTLSGASGTANAAIGTVIGTLVATANGGALAGTSFSIASQSTPGAFRLVGTVLQFASAMVAAGSYSLSITVTAGNAANSPQTYPVGVTIRASGGATGNFRVVNRQIIDPHGSVWHGHGINIGDTQMAEAVSNSAAQPLLTLFPNTNIVRLACSSYQPPSYYAAFITTLTALGIVVEIEDHTSSDGTDSGGGTGVVYTGTLLTDELNWYAALATAYQNNPYVWFGTNNEPSIDPSVAALSTWHGQTYNAIRNTGAANMILIDVPAGGLPQYLGSSGGMTVSVYATMTNIAWDLHSYNWIVNFSTDYATNYNQLIADIALCQQIGSADGTVPVIIGEYGDSTIGNAEDAGWLQNCQAVQNSVGATGGSQGCMAWLWNPGPGFFDNLCTASSVNAPYGTEVAAWIATAT